MSFRRILGVIFVVILSVGAYFVYTSGLYKIYIDEIPNIPYIDRIPYVKDLPWLVQTTATPDVAEDVTTTGTPTAEASNPAEGDEGDDEGNGELAVADVSAPVEVQVTPAPVNEVVILTADTITTLDPYHMVSTHPDASVSVHLWEALTRLNDDLVIEPHLAESWRIVNNFTWEFKLRPGITFHNGEVINAQAVRFSVDRAKLLQNSLETFPVDVDLKDVEIIDDFTIRFVTNQPIANLPYHLSFLEILPPIYYSEGDPVQLATEPVGSGPYQLGEPTDGRRVVLEAVPDYWQGQPMIPRLVFQVVSDVEDRLATLSTEEVALATDLSPTLTATWEIPGTRLEAIESTQRLFVGMNILPGTPFEVLEVRQALNYGVNVKEIVDNWLAGYGQRYGSWVNPPNHNPALEPWPYDPDRARELLVEAGYTDGFTTTLAIPIGLYNQEAAIAQSIALQLAEIGVNVTVEEFEWPIYVRRLLSRNKPPLFLLGLNSHGNDLEDAKNLSMGFPFNPTGWENDFYEEGLRRALNTLNDDARLRSLQELQKIAYEEAPWIWLWRTYNFYGVSDALDWTPRRDGLVYLYQSVAGSP